MQIEVRMLAKMEIETKIKLTTKLKIKKQIYEFLFSPL